MNSAAFLGAFKYLITPDKFARKHCVQRQFNAVTLQRLCYGEHSHLKLILLMTSLFIQQDKDSC